MSLMSESEANAVRARLEQLPNPVRLLFFTQESECHSCRATRDLLHELSDLSGKLDVEVYDFVRDAEIAEQYGIDKIPAIAVIAGTDTRMRFYGVPSGYEFISLLQAIERAGSRHTGLSPDTIARLHDVTSPVHLQVFVTPTCPYCPSAVVTAHQLAMANPNIRADMVEATEYPHLVQRYRVAGVPRVVINESRHFEGALPEHLFLEQVLDAVRTSSAPIPSTD